MMPLHLDHHGHGIPYRRAPEVPRQMQAFTAARWGEIVQGDWIGRGADRTVLEEVLAMANTDLAMNGRGRSLAERAMRQATEFMNEHRDDVHRHGALGLMTPHDIHYGLAAGKRQRRAGILRAAYQAHPERFPRGVPVPPPLPTAAWINKPLVATPEGILRAQAQRDRLLDLAAVAVIRRSPYPGAE